MDEKKKPHTNTTDTRVRREFAALVDPLEHASRARLGNPKRAACIAEYEQHPEAVRRCAEQALARGTRNPVGFFAWMIENSWHELDPLADSPSEPAAPVVEWEPPPVSAAEYLQGRPQLRDFVRTAAQVCAGEDDFRAEMTSRFGIDAELAAGLYRWAAKENE